MSCFTMGIISSGRLIIDAELQQLAERSGERMEGKKERIEWVVSNERAGERGEGGEKE